MEERGYLAVLDKRRNSTLTNRRNVDGTSSNRDTRGVRKQVVKNTVKRNRFDARARFAEVVMPVAKFA